MADCKHGIQEDDCDLCQGKKMERPLALKPFFLKKNGTLGLILDAPAKGKKVEVFLATEPVGISKVDKKTIDVFTEAELTIEHRTKLLRAAMKAGHIYMPDRPLRQREGLDMGPSKCWNCERTVSFDKGSFGCYDCRSYACICGSCICDYPGGKNYSGQHVPAGNGLSCNKKERKHLMRISKALSLFPF
jgi:hypothetical protein